jgi:hypothetical protein
LQNILSTGITNGQAGKNDCCEEQDRGEVYSVNLKKQEIDIGANLKIVEWLKAELVDTVAVLLKSLLRAGSDATSDALATLIIIAYVLGRRVGVSFQIIDMRVKHKLNSSINETNEIEQWYGDLSKLQNYLENKENKTR